MTATVVRLPTFLPIEGLPETQAEIARLLAFPPLGFVSFVLGPPGTNIGQAEEAWAKRWRLHDLPRKRQVAWCKLPEEAVARAKALHRSGEVAIFWTCAVFAREKEVFFGNTDTLPFFIQHTMNLDEMQLAHRSCQNPINGHDNLQGVKIASHVSPAPLVKSLVEAGAVVIDANSNSAAAEMCRDHQVDACITTEAARQNCGLIKAHSFGSPPMVFFGGITRAGAELLAATYNSPPFAKTGEGF